MRQATRGSLLLPVIIAITELRLQPAVTSLAVDLEPKPHGPAAPIRYFIVPNISLMTIANNFYAHTVPFNSVLTN